MSSGNCKYCGLPIWWSKQDDKWIPFENAEFTRKHDCPSLPKTEPKPKEEPKPRVPPLTEDEIVLPLTEDEILWLRYLRTTLKMMKQ